MRTTVLFVHHRRTAIQREADVAAVTDSTRPVRPIPDSSSPYNSRLGCSARANRLFRESLIRADSIRDAHCSHWRWPRCYPWEIFNVMASATRKVTTLQNKLRDCLIQSHVWPHQRPKVNSSFKFD